MAIHACLIRFVLFFPTTKALALPIPLPISEAGRGGLLSGSLPEEKNFEMVGTGFVDLIYRASQT